MDFKEAYKMPIGNNVEKKGKFSYLSWCFAVQHLRENFPKATWEIKENTEGQPLFAMPQGFMVCVTVIVDGFKFPQWHPILNYSNKPIDEPNSFDVNTAIQRCLTKAIGLATGIGLGLYAGEDLPKEDDTPPPPPKLTKSDFQAKIENLPTIADIEAWEKAHLPKAESALSKADYGWFVNYIKQVKDGFAPKKTAPEFVICPNLKKEMPLADCKLSECFAKCNVANPK